VIYRTNATAFAALNLVITEKKKVNIYFPCLPLLYLQEPPGEEMWKTRIPLDIIPLVAS